MSRTRIWVLALLLFFYLAGILLLSAVSMQEPHNKLRGVSKQHPNNNNMQVSRVRGLEYSPVHGIRPPMRKIKIQWCTDLKYFQPPRNTVALVSFPGSGNTWLRYLLQQATGIYTGSIYKDYGLLKNGFPAENVMNGSVSVVKTHEWGPLARKPFKKAILLVRAPGPAIQAEFNRQSGGHIGFASPERYKRTRGKYWQQFVKDKLHAWKQINLDWLYNFSGPTHVLFYEQLVENVAHTLRSVMEFLEIPIDEYLMKCALERQEGIYRRKRRVLNFDPYNSIMKKQLQVEQEKVYEAIYNVALPAKKKR